MVTPIVLVEATQLTVAAAVYYAAPDRTEKTAKARVVIWRFILTNTSGADATATVYLVPVDDTAADDTTLVKDRKIPAGQSIEIREARGQVLLPGYSIQMLASAGSAITPVVSGVEIA